MANKIAEAAEQLKETLFKHPHHQVCQQEICSPI